MTLGKCPYLSEPVSPSVKQEYSTNNITGLL